MRSTEEFLESGNINNLSVFLFLHSNRKFAEFYTEDLMANSPREIEKKSLEIYRLGWRPLFTMRGAEGSSKCVESFERAASSGQGVLDVFEDLIVRNNPPMDIRANFKPAGHEMVQELQTVIEKLPTIAQGQKFAFKPYSAMEIYVGKQIAISKEFKFLKKSSGTKGTLVFDYLLPFNARNHADDNCVTVDDLPRFYKYKGKLHQNE